MKPSNLTIIIVTFESSEVIRECLSKINLNKYQVFVVDNNSQDNTVKIIEEGFPEVNLIKLDNNVGYGRANNVALCKTNTDYALILNPDAFIEDKDIEGVIKVMYEDKKIALASPRIINSRDYKDFEQQRKKLQTIYNNQNLTSTNFIVGCTMFMNMKIFRKIGFFDEKIFMFSEDNEISARSIKNGYKNIIINNLTAFHAIGGSSKKSLRTIYRRSWHLAWSKSHWKMNSKSWLSAKRSVLRLSFIYLIRAIWYFIKCNKEGATSRIASCMGFIASFFGIEAFDKKGIPRG